MHAWRVVAVVAALVAYALLSHQLMVHHAQAPWAVAALFGPLLGGVSLVAWQRRQLWTLAACLALVLLLAAIVWRGGIDGINRMYVLQHAGIHLMLGWTFFSTLRPGGTPLITALAQRLHQRFTAEMRAYTRWLTGLWAAYFVAMVAVSAVLYLLAPWAWWSVFCNLLTPLAAVLFFVVEHLLRYVRHPEFERVSMRAAFRAYQEGAAPDGPVSR